ncbi:MAG: hypothetical protein K5796_02530 [Lachnospiraceae bacterium]|nr:hypothetical protein [Lachnospiraceae bacterium]
MDLFNIESIDTVIQLIATLICVIISVMRALATKKRAWVMLFFTAFIYFLGDLYWQIFVVVHGHIPEYSYIPYLSWYASYLFFILLLVEVRGERDKRKESPVLWPVPAFTVGMAVLLHAETGLHRKYHMPYPDDGFDLAGRVGAS